MGGPRTRLIHCGFNWITVGVSWLRMALRRTLFLSLFLFIQLAFLQLALGQSPSLPYDPGPDPKDPLQKELIELVARYPYAPELSWQLLGDQRFRPDFGPTMWRMPLGQNEVKILFIGQDPTHIAEGSGRAATAGFGGRGQNLAKYFGVFDSAAFINAYPNTINGQYRLFDTPVFKKNPESGEIDLWFDSLVRSDFWALSNDPRSPLVSWRNEFIDWIIRNNKESLKLIVTFGSAAEDALAVYLESKGVKVPARYSKESLKHVEIPLLKSEYAGGNNTFPVPLTANGKDFYQKAFETSDEYEKEDLRERVMKALQEDPKKHFKNIAFGEGGLLQNGLLHPAQLGGFSIPDMEVNGEKTRSIKGLSLSDGTMIKHHIPIIELPHPTFLSRIGYEAPWKASALVKKDVEPLKSFLEKGWFIEPDGREKGDFFKGENYKYRRTDIPKEHFDFGAPNTRTLPVSLASRLYRHPDVIVLGTRDWVQFDYDKIWKAKRAKPSQIPPQGEIFTRSPRLPARRKAFDSGPGEFYANLMKENLNLGWVFKRKEGLSFEEHGINAYQTMTHPIVGDFGHYRGTFDNPRALILADPQGLDDMLTARALTGERGQYLHGMMEDLGIKDQYLIIKTVPFGMDGASPEEWAEVLERTSRYRETLLKEVLSRNRPELIISDGSYAELEIKRILLDIDSTKKTPLFHIRRSGDRNHWGFQAAFERIQNLEPFQDKGYRGVRADIPRSHLSYYARNWEGTSGDRVIAPEKSDPNYGKAVAIIAPQWATEQRVELPKNIQRKVDKLREKLRVWGMRLPGESVPQFLDRRPDTGWDRRKMTPNPPQIGGSRCSTLFKLAS